MKKLILSISFLITLTNISVAEESLNLKTAITETLKTHYQLKNAILDTAIAEDQIKTVSDAYLPTVSSTLTHTKSETSANPLSPIPATDTENDSLELSASKLLKNGMTISTTGNLSKTDTSSTSIGSLSDDRDNVTIALSFPLIKNFSGKSVRYQSQIANLNKNITDFNTNHLKQSLILKTITTFYAVALRLEEKKAILENLEGSKSVLETMEHRSKIGTAELKHYLLSKAAYKFQNMNLINAEKNLEKSYLDLLTLIGKEERHYFPKLEYKLMPKMSPIKDAIKIINSALDNRNDLKELENQFEIAKLNIDLEEDTNSAELDLNSSYAYDGFNSSNAFASDKTPGWFMGVSFKKKFGGTSKIAEKEKTKEKLANSLSDFKRNLKKEIQISICEVNRLIDLVKESNALVTVQSGRLKEEEKDFNLGRTSVKDLTDARDDLTSAQLNLAKSKINLLIALANLTFLQGELVE